MDGQPTQESSRSGRTAALRGRFLNLVEALVFVAVVSQILGLFGSFHFFLDLLSHFRVQATVSLLLGAAVLLISGRRRFGFVGLAAGMVLGCSLAPFFTAVPASAGSHTYRFLVMNVLTRNANKSGVIDYIRRQDPDLFVLLEVDHEWVRAVEKSLGERWAFQITDPHGDNFGILMFSKLAWVEANVVDFGDDGLPSVDATFATSGGRFRVIGTHPVPPMSPRSWNSRNTLLLCVAESIRDGGLPNNTLLAGDLNCSPWSPVFKNLLRTSGLTDSARGHGLRPTWYVLPTFLAALPIDHVLTGENIKVLRRTVGPDLGSDHRALVVDFALSN